MRILVTGGAGFIGSHIVEHFQGKADIRVIDNLRTGRKENLKGLDCHFIEASILDKDALLEAMTGVDYVFHLAAMVSVPQSMDNPSEALSINSQGTLNVLESARNAGVKKLAFSSTSAIYGEQSPEQPKVESMPPAPISPYGITKLSGEYYCNIFQQQGWLQTVCLRYFNVFGPRQNPHGDYAAVIPFFISQAVANKPLTIHGDGSQTRDFVFVKDVAALNAAMVESDHHGIFNVARGEGSSIQELAEKIIAATNSKSEISHGAPRAGDIQHSVADVSKLQSCGLAAHWSLDEGLDATCKSWS